MISILDLASGDAIEAKHRGLLPFRVWQIFDAMVEFAAAGKGAQFVCAAGTLTHYIGDACQPLISPICMTATPSERWSTPSRGVNEKVKIEERTFGSGVHTGYEDTMISLFRTEVLDGLKLTPKTKKAEMIEQRIRRCQADHCNDEKDLRVDTADEDR